MLNTLSSREILSIKVSCLQKEASVNESKSKLNNFSKHTTLCQLKYVLFLTIIFSLKIYDQNYKPGKYYINLDKI